MKLTLLQADNGQMTVIVLYIVVFLIGIFITRAVFSIGTIVRNSKAQTKLLGHIADKLEVDPDLVKTEIFEARGEFYQSTKKNEVK